MITLMDRNTRKARQVASRVSLTLLLGAALALPLVFLEQTRKIPKPQRSLPGRFNPMTVHLSGISKFLRPLMAVQIFNP